MINLLETAGKLCVHRCREGNLLEEGSVSSDDHKELENKEELEEEEIITANLIDLSLSNEKASTDDARKKTVDVGSNCKKEHMFDKVVTPSDVGKLNRLVIPKQHAEKYFPLDTSSNEKGSLLNFEDRNGKQWRFRYSYWNSSQSYVMTKGWSRFVKEKKLIAGDTVTFQRGVGESGQWVLFIDWRHRPNATFPANYPPSFMQFGLQNYHPSLRFGKLFVPQFRNLNYATTSILQQQPYRHNQGNFNGGYNLMRPIGRHQIGEHDHNLPIVIDSTPIVPGTSVGKRLRLFGVNMECGSIQEDDDQIQYSSLPTTIPCPPHLASSSITSSSPIQSTVVLPPHEVSKKAKTSLSFDLDL